MKKIFFIVFLLFFNVVQANTYIETKVDWKTLRVIEFDKNNQLYNLKIARVIDWWDSLANILLKNNWITWVNGQFFWPADYWNSKPAYSTNNETYVEWLKIASNDDTWDRVVFWWDKNYNPLLFQTYYINDDKEDTINYWLSNWPLLLQDWISKTQESYDRWMTIATWNDYGQRNFICSNKDWSKIYFWYMSSATIDEMPQVLLDFGCYNALNLDAWYSSNFVYNWKALVWPTTRKIIDSIYIQAKWFDVKSTNAAWVSVYKMIIEQAPINTVSNHITYLNGFISVLNKFKDKYQNKYITDFDSNPDWNFDNWYKIDITSNLDLKKVYLLNIIIDNLKSAVKTLEKLTNSWMVNLSKVV